MAWGWRGENGQREPFCGNEKLEILRGECVGTDPLFPTEHFCVRMRGETCGEDMCGSMRQGCVF